MKKSNPFESALIRDCGCNDLDDFERLPPPSSTSGSRIILPSPMSSARSMVSHAFMPLRFPSQGAQFSAFFSPPAFSSGDSSGDCGDQAAELVPIVAAASQDQNTAMSSARKAASGRSAVEPIRVLLSPPEGAAASRNLVTERAQPGGSARPADPKIGNHPEVSRLNCNIQADPAGSKPCLYPSPLFPRFPRDVYTSNMTPSNNPYLTCEIEKFWVSYVRSYRTSYWGFRTIEAIENLPAFFRPMLWDHVYKVNNVSFSMRTYFGPYSPSRAPYIKAVLWQHVLRFIYGFPPDGTRLWFVLQNQGGTYCEDPGDEGHNNHHGKIWLCSSSFYNRSTNHLAWVIGHELMHKLFGMDDQIFNGVKAYGDENARGLALADPNKAINNNDNYGIWLARMYFVWDAKCSIVEAVVACGIGEYSYDMKKCKWISYPTPPC